MTTGCKVWLWIVLISNCVSMVSGLSTMALISIIGGALNIIGAATLLFAHRKIGFYLLLIVAIGVCVFNIYAGVPIAMAIIPAIISPLITYLFIKKNSEIIK